MEVSWSSLAKAQLDDIIDYYELNASPKVARRLFETLVDAADRLINFPYLGKMAEANPIYRILVEGNYLIIYSIEEDYIRIAFLFDSRQDSGSLLAFLTP